MKQNLIYILFFILFWCCSDEKDLEPSPEPEFNYTLPQGNHDYDKIIVDYYNRFGCYFLYDYTLDQAYWSVDESLGDYYMVILPDKSYIAPLLDLVDRKFIGHYPDTLLRRTLPLRIFLAADIIDNFWGESSVVLKGYHSLFISGARYADYTTDYINHFKSTINMEYVDNCLVGNISISEEFEQVSKAFYGLSTFSYANGFFSRTGAKSVQSDWQEYLEFAVSKTRDELTATYFNQSKDPNGLIEKKYEIVLDYMLKNYHIDLEAIGNDVEPFGE